ncbi:MAG TPA: HAD family hydrolase [Candidatus Nanoarchaeia archaeon]|nr:HAD family hydrolase [Candidatus Nanoarchaeia archaeon]
MTKENKSKVNKERIKAVVFDIGGVLLLGDKKVKYGHQNINVHTFMAKKFNLSLKKWFDKIEEPYSKAITGEWSKEKVLKKMSENLSSSKKIKPEKIEEWFVKSHRKYFRKNKKLFDFAKNLKDRCYIGILSDQTYFSEQALLTKYKMENFNPVIISCEEGIRKPDKKIYRLLKKRLDGLEKKKGNKEKVKYEEIVFIDNRDWNLKPARELGMKTILFKTNKQTIKKIKEILKQNKE